MAYDKETSKNKYQLLSRLECLLKKESSIEEKEEDIKDREEAILRKEEEIYEVEKNLREDIIRLKSKEATIEEKRAKLDKIIDTIIKHERKLTEEKQKKREELYRLLEEEKNQDPDSESYSLLKRQENEIRKSIMHLINETWHDDEKEKVLIEQEKKLIDEEEKTIQDVLSEQDELVGVHDESKKLILDDEKIGKKHIGVLDDLSKIRDQNVLTDKPSEIPGLGFKPVSGEIYLINETDQLVSGVVPWKSINFFKQHVTAERKGMVVTRTNPDRLPKENCFKDTTCIWLTETHEEHDTFETIYFIEEISMKSTKFIQDNTKSILLLDGLEYLITNTGFDPILSFIQYLRDMISDKDTYILLPIDFESLEDKQLRKLERETNVIN